MPYINTAGKNVAGIIHNNIGNNERTKGAQRDLFVVALYARVCAYRARTNTPWALHLRALADVPLLDAVVVRLAPVGAPPPRPFSCPVMGFGS